MSLTTAEKIKRYKKINNFRTILPIAPYAIMGIVQLSITMGSDKENYTPQIALIYSLVFVSIFSDYMVKKSCYKNLKAGYQFYSQYHTDLKNQAELNIAPENKEKFDQFTTNTFINTLFRNILSRILIGTVLGIAFSNMMDFTENLKDEEGISDAGTQRVFSGFCLDVFFVKTLIELRTDLCLAFSDLKDSGVLEGQLSTLIAKPSSHEETPTTYGAINKV